MKSRPDLFLLLGPLGWTFGTAASLSAVIAFAVNSVFVPFLWATGAFTLAMVVVLAMRAAIQSSSGEWPNRLVELAPPRRARERDGVQLVTMPERVSVSGGERFEVEVLLQNCTTAAKQATVVLEPLASYSAGRAPVTLPAATAISLAPGEVKRVTLSCVAANGAIGEHLFRTVPVVTGDGGERKRPWHANPWRQSPPMLLELLAVFSAFSLGTESEAVRVVLKPGSSTSEAAPSVSETSLWTPLSS